VQGIFDARNVTEKYDVITIIDVIEHVENPLVLLSDAHTSLSTGGILVLTTPDVGSFFARILGWKWWHFRVAHITYFDKKTIALTLDKAGFEIVDSIRPAWYFTLSYLLERVMVYFPKFLRFTPAQWMKKITIKLNLADSFLIICKPKNKI
jgi:2-polyprenyl-3-methyl-5-hydroxy-6-metoxy-1,4-benzoquinol methylase